MPNNLNDDIEANERWLRRQRVARAYEARLRAARAGRIVAPPPPLPAEDNAPQQPQLMYNGAPVTWNRGIGGEWVLHTQPVWFNNVALRPAVEAAVESDEDIQVIKDA